MKRKDRIKNIEKTIEAIKELPTVRLYKGADGRNNQIIIDHLLKAEKIILDHLERATGSRPVGGLKSTTKLIDMLKKEAKEHGTTTEMVDFDMTPMLASAFQVYLQEQEVKEKLDNEPDY